MINFIQFRIFDTYARLNYSSIVLMAAVGLGIGTYISNAFHIDLRGERRGDYKYSKFQTGSSSTPGFTRNVRTRNFKVTSNALMLSGWIDLGFVWNNLVWNVGSVSLQPFVGMVLTIWMSMIFIP